MAHSLSIPFDGTQLCKHVNPEIFFPDPLEEQEDVVFTKTKQAKAICAECPLTEECLRYALENPELQGIWGGATLKERQLIRRRMRMRAKR
jgi:WhiB family redox-sensing transcriptional regulator